MYTDVFGKLFWGLFIAGLLTGAAVSACGFSVYKASQHIHIEVK